MSRRPVIGIDLGATHMQVGVVDARNTLHARLGARTRAGEGCDAVIACILQCVHNVCARADMRFSRIGAVGIAAPGAIDIPRGVVIDAPNLGWRDVPLRDVLCERLKCPVIVDNDVNAAVWGEARLGAGRGHDDLLGVWVGTGVGGGLVLNGRLYHGPMFTAGEIGQTIIRPGGGTGSRTVEDFCSRTGMSRIIRRRLRRNRNSILHEMIDQETGITGSKQLAQAVRSKDALAIEVVDQAAFLLGVSIANWVTVLALKRVVIGGGVTEALGRGFLQRIRESFNQHVFPHSARLPHGCELVMTALKADAGLLGAAMLACEGIRSSH
jgi:glucokinase